MSQPSPTIDPVLRDLALLYIALAHGADQDLDAAELDVVTRRLQGLQEGASGGTVLRAVDEALRVYAAAREPAQLDEAVRRLAGAVPLPLRARVLQDLTDIANADDRFLYVEARLIGELFQAWREDPDGVPGVEAAAWSLFGPVDRGWSTVHDLALVYLTLAQWTDKELAVEEVEAILQKIGEWMPGVGRDVVEHVLWEVMPTYDAEQPGRTFDDAVLALRDVLPAHQRQAVLDDLRYIADADHVLLVEERMLIEAIARVWHDAA